MGKDRIQDLIDETPIKYCPLSSGERLSYRVYNNDIIDKSTKHTLVVIAGYGGDSTHLAAELSVLPQLSDHKLIGINPRGWGTSSQNNINYTHEENAQDIKEVIDIIGLKTTMVIGHSTGGPIAALLAINHPGTIKSAFLMNSVPIHGQRYHCHRTGKLISTDEEMVEHGKFLDSLGFHGEDEESCYKAWFRICPTIPDVGSSAMKRFHYGAMNFRAGLGAHSANSKFNIAPIKTIRSAPSDALKDLQVPIIVLHGSNDTVVDSLIVRSVTNLAIKEKWATNDLLSYYEHKSNHFPLYENVSDWADTYRKALEENLKLETVP